MDSSLAQIVGHMGPAAIGVAWVLLLMALASLAVFFERLFTFARSRAAARRGAGEARALLEADEAEGLVKKSGDNKSRLGQRLGVGAATKADV